MSSVISLSELPLGCEAIISALPRDDICASRLIELGFYPGASVRPLFRAVFGDPCAYSVQNAIIALRKKETKKILVSPI